MKIEFPQDAIVVFVGAMGTGKSTFAQKHFNKHHYISSDYIREQLSGDFEDQHHNAAVFEILYATLEARAKAGIFTIVDSTGSRGLINQAEQIAKKYDRPIIAIKFPHLKDEEITEERMRHRMRYIDVYYSQANRIDNTTFPKSYTVYDIDDVDSTTISIINEEEKNVLDPNQKYVVVPDLHGEWKMLYDWMRIYSITEYKYIFLGDIVDRGESSAKTFAIVDELIKQGHARGVISNHDNKFYRYLKKWVADENRYLREPDYDYGMTFAHGLQRTVVEFRSMSDHDKIIYSRNFIGYYENLNPYLTLEKDGVKHYFAHAGINHNIARGFPASKADIACLLYETFPIDHNHVDVLFKNTDYECVHVHVGHDANHGHKTFFAETNTRLTKHDIGLGKKVIVGVPKLMVL